MYLGIFSVNDTINFKATVVNRSDSAKNAVNIKISADF